MDPKTNRKNAMTVNKAEKEFKRLKSKRNLLAMEYDILPIRRYQSIRPESGLYKELSDVVYEFSAYPKGRPELIFTFRTGAPAGQDFLRILGKTLPPLSSWEVVACCHRESSLEKTTPTKSTDFTHPFNRQMLDLLNLFFLRYRFDLNQASGKIFIDINNQMASPQYKCARSVNKILSSFKTRSTDLVAWLKTSVNGRKVREFKFDLIREQLIDNNLQDEIFVD